ncbi:hypothetical protein LSCM1_03586 [Leishmania martiniquensis]|uniref:Uncharacterized protein n=1 Tax=Leishmania martiniquensis TaxID=1580590 RepID=A0A836HCY9_9TRYP|nr:hypothetical protein LSCM1_03586 [Leishmania martiniquensis]
MDQGAVSEWSVVGTFRKRPVPQGPIVDFASDGSHRDSLDNADAPVLLYGMKGDVNQHQSRVPRYIARRIAIPPPSLLKMKVVSLALPRPDEAWPRSEDLFFVDCPEPPSAPSHHRDRAHRQKSLVIGTILPPPPQLTFLLPFAVCLADIALLAVSLTTYKPEQVIIAACCMLVLVPDIGAIVFLLKRGMYSVTIALHLLLWRSVVLLFLQPFVSLLFMVHFLLTALVVLCCLRVRASTYMTFCRLR